MRKLKFTVAAVPAFILFGTFPIFGQHRSPGANIPSAGNTQGTLTVTLTVISSVGVVTGPDGQQRVVMANAAAASDNVSRLQYVGLHDANSGAMGSGVNGSKVIDSKVIDPKVIDPKINDPKVNDSRSNQATPRKTRDQ